MERTTSRRPGGGVREFEHEGLRWRALEGWGSNTGYTLCYFLVLQDGTPSVADSLDRRARLAPGESLVQLSEDQLQEMLGTAVPLTATERRVSGPGEAIWLIQNSGPVWAEGGLAAGLAGIMMTRLGKEPQRIERQGDHLARLSEEELTGLLSDMPVDPHGPGIPAEV